MSALGIAAKNAPVALPIFAGAWALDDTTIVKAAAICVGLLFGAMWRAGSLANEGKTWSMVRTDLLISILIGGANAVLVMALVDLANVGPLLAMAGGVIVGATGLRALPEMRKALLDSARARLLGEGVTTVPPKDADMDAKLDELTRRLNDEPDRNP